MARRKRVPFPLNFIFGVSKRKTGKARLKYAVMFLIGAAATWYYQGAPSADEVHQYISESVMLNDVKVVDGDTLHIKGKSFRLFGIDAPEHDQTCYKADGKTWPCGRAARTALWKMTNASKSNVMS